MAAHTLNLAKRPFLDTRPVNVTVAILAAAAIVLTAFSVATVRRSTGEAGQVRAEVQKLRADLTKAEAQKRAGEARMARHDIYALSGGARSANALARLKAFSWTRFLSRLERVMPPDQRVVAIALTKAEEAPQSQSRAEAEPIDAYPLSLTLVTRDPDGLVKAIRAFYASPYFDRPVPLSEQSPEAGKGDLWRLAIGVVYRDHGAAGAPGGAP